MSSPVIPTIQYDDAPAALDWLQEAFGLQRHLVVEGEGGRIDHAQMTYGTGMIMLSSTQPDVPKAVPVVYIVVGDVDAHCERAVAAGAGIESPPTPQDYGGSAYSCRDPEGNVWHFGSYDPWAPAS